MLIKSLYAWLHFVVADASFGVRLMLKTPASNALSIMVTALGIAGTTTAFSVVHSVLLRSMPYGEPEQLVYVWSPNLAFHGTPAEVKPNVPDFYEWQQDSRSFSSMASFYSRVLNFENGNETLQVNAAVVSGDFFKTLDAWPSLGRALNMNDDRPGHEQVAVISDSFWRSEMGSETKPIGRQLYCSGKKYTVVGVMPRDFGYPRDGDIPYQHSGFQRTDLWIPAAYSVDERSNRTTFLSSNVIARLRNGVSGRSAQLELIAIERQLQLLYPPMWRGWTVKVSPLVDTILGPVQQMLWLLFAAVGVVLLISMSNVANILLSGFLARSHEISIRHALGADRTRIISQLLAESLITSFVGGGIGVFLTFLSLRVLTRLDPGGIPGFDSATVNSSVLLFALVTSVVAGLFSGITPALYASVTNVNELLKRGGSRLSATADLGRSSLVVLQVALSMILLTGAGLMIRSYLRLVSVNPGFFPTTLTFSVVLDDRHSKPENRADMLIALLERFQNLPGVTAVGASSNLPLGQTESLTEVEISGIGRTRNMVENRAVTSGYRRALGILLVQGRDFTTQDASRANVVIVNEAFAKEYFKGRSAIGEHVRIGIGDLSKTPWSTIVGVVGNTRNLHLEESPIPQILQPVKCANNFALSSKLPKSRILREAQEVLRTFDRTLSLTTPATMQQRMDLSNSTRNFQTALLLGFAALATALVVAGLYGLIAYSVRTRRDEIAIRLALGSSSLRIVSLVLVSGIRATLAGMVLGWTFSIAIMRTISTWLYGITVIDPLTFLLVPLFVLLVAVTACIVPSVSAIRISPRVVLGRH